jgi:undecaprenyl-diphosphatase
VEWLSWVFLGLLQGLTEFLPVSSSGHLVLAQSFLGVGTPGVLLEVTVHVATAAAVVVLFARELWRMVLAVARWPLGGGRRHPEDAAWRGLVGLLLLATAVTSVIGFGLEPFIRGAFDAPPFAAAMLLVTGLVLSVSARLRRGRRHLDSIGPLDAVWIGVAQGLAIFPGLSRSGLTIVGGLGRGLAGTDAARFSFLLSLPAIVGAALVEALTTEGLGAALLAGVPILGLVLAFAAAFVSGLAAMVLLVKVVRIGLLHRFAWYCWAVGGAALAWFLL